VECVGTFTENLAQRRKKKPPPDISAERKLPKENYSLLDFSLSSEKRNWISDLSVEARSLSFPSSSLKPEAGG
jgi:hypothetical protein